MRFLCLTIFVVMVAPGVTAQTTMTRLAPEPETDYQFGWGLTVIGQTLFVQSSNQGIELFSNETGDWLRTDTLLAGKRNLRARSIGGDLFVVDAPNVLRFEKDATGWHVASTSSLPDLGSTVGEYALYYVVDDSLLLINMAGPAGNWVDLYKRTGNEWALYQTIDPVLSGDFRFKCQLGSRLVFGAPREQTNGANSGSAYVYKRGGNGNYSLEQRIVPDDVEESDQFGRRIACGERGLVIHSYSGGKTHLFTREDTLWQQAGSIQVPGNNRFLTVRWLGDLLMVRNENLMEPLPGQTFDAYESTVYLLELEGVQFNIRHVIKSPNPVDRTYESSDGGFGYYTAYDGDWLAISAYFRDTRAFLSVGEVYVTRLSELPLASGLNAHEALTRLISLFPNPAASYVNLSVALDKPQSVSIRVVDVLGRTVIEEQEVASWGGPFQRRVDLRGLSNGTYIVSTCIGADACSGKALFVTGN